MDGFENSLMDVFLFETNAFIEDMENVLMRVERGEETIEDNVPELFRMMHTIKSSAAMMGFEGISAIAHHAEDLLAYARDNGLGSDPKALAQLVFSCLDAIKRGLSDPGLREEAPLVERIDQFLMALKAGGHLAQVALAIRFVPGCQMIGMRAFELIAKVQKIAALAGARPQEGAPDYEARLARDGLTLTLTTALDPEALRQQVLKLSAFVAEASLVPLQAPDPPQVEAEADRPGPAAVLPVALNRLDQIVELAGELTTADMRLSHALQGDDPQTLRDAASDLSKLILQMQRATLSIRMVPLRNTFHKLRRMERDISQKLGREVDFRVSGEETELDKQVVDALMPVLIHLLRNAIDHGIEPPQDRERAGKPRVGVVSLTAKANARHALITLSDDGRGLDRELIAGRAVDRGLIQDAQRGDLTGEQITSLVFLPGFTTREQVTELSGRGVGLDVVAQAVKQLMGSVSLTTLPGKGSTFTLRLPLTLSVMDALLLTCEGDKAILPLGDVVQIFQPEEGEFVMVNGQDSVLYRQVCYKIKTVAQFLGRPKREDYRGGAMILLKSDVEPYVLYADEIADHRSVVVKPVPPLFAGIPGIAGCTVLGTGDMALIIDAQGFYSRGAKGGGANG